MKKLIAGSLMASMLVVPAMAQDVSVYLNNERMIFDQNPIIENGRTLVPLRSIFEGLGAEVKWNSDIQEVRGITEYKEVVLRVGETCASVNGHTVTLDVPAKIENGRTLVPLRFISESLDAEVKWNAEEYRIDIIDEEVNLPEVKDVIEENGGTFYLCKNGEVYVEGSNSVGQLGVGHKNTVTRPTKVEALNGISIKKIKTTCDLHWETVITLFISEENDIYVCGYNGAGELGLGHNGEVLIPTRIKELDGKEIKKIGRLNCGIFYLLKNGEVYVSGYNGSGKFGIGHENNINKITKVEELEGIKILDIVHDGERNVVYYISDKGEVYVAGEYPYSEVLIGDTNNVVVPTKIDELENIVDIEFSGVFDNNTYFLTEEGEVYVIGENINGELGLGHRRKVTVPTKISGLEGIKIKKVVYGDRSSYTKYLDENGEVYISGCEYVDELGEIVARRVTEEIVKLKGLENIKIIEIDESNIMEHKLIAENGNSYIIRGITDGITAIKTPQEEYDNIYSDSRSNIVCVKKDNKFGYINTSGEEVIPCIYDDIGEFYDGELRVERNGKQGYINEEGEEFIPCIYDYVDYFNSYGLVRVTKNGKDGYLNKMGEEVLPCLYDELGEYKDGLLRVEVEGDYIYYNTQGEVVEPSEIKKDLDDKYEKVNNFNNGLASVLRNGKWGYINEEGEEVIPCIYEQIALGNGQFSEGIAPVKKDGKWGYINEKGENITEFIYEGHTASSFYNGIAKVSRNGKAGYIDREGKEIIPCEYDMIHTGLMTSDSSRFIAKKDGKYGYINRECEEIVPFEYDNIYPDVYRGESILVAEKDAKKFQVEYSGNLVEID